MPEYPDIFVATVVMPERGVYTVKVEDEFLKDALLRNGGRGRFIVELDYGEDDGRAISAGKYDPAVHGDRIPGFRLVRPISAADAKTLEENESLAASMRDMFIAGAKASAPDVKVVYSRLSFGRKRFFIRYSAGDDAPDLSNAANEIRLRFGVEINQRAVGPRDAIAMAGAVGPCGRICCCSSWQHRYPYGLSSAGRDARISHPNGVCGRFKCCLAFERNGSDGDRSGNGAP